MDDSIPLPDLAALDTKQRLIEAGLHVFAAHGFADAGLRTICSLAGANPAAVNYHFGDKSRFYAEVLTTAHRRAVERRPMPRLADDPADPAGVLRAWIRWFLELLLVEEGTGPLGRLMTREMADPTPALHRLMESIAPVHQNLAEILGALIGEQAPRTRQMCLLSILGQCHFYKHAQPAMRSLRHAVPEPPATFDGLDGEGGYAVDAIAEHIATFSLAGIAARGTGDVS